MRSHPAATHPDLIVGMATADDAGVYRLSPDRALVQTVDFFTPVVDDPYDWGRIAAVNALSDIYAMGGEPLTALQLVSWPRDVIGFDVLAQVIAGGADVMAGARCTIVGGHSIDDQEPKYGFAVTGLVDPSEVITNAGAVPGDRLVVTKPIGTGVIATAIKRDSCPNDVMASAIAAMTHSNAGAAAAMRAVGVHAATDVTGFGLLGHLLEMLVASGVSADVDAASVPVMDGTVELLDAGCYPGGSSRNLEAVLPFLDLRGVDDRVVRILADAQTSGGLLIAVPPSRTDDLLRGLSSEPVAAVIGTVVEATPCRIRLDGGAG